MPSCVCPTINDSEETDDAQMLVPGGNSYRCSSVVVFPSRENEEIEIDDKETATMNEAGTPKVRKVRRGMSFGEGCVYCVLLWIPVIIIACFFFVYVLKDKGTSPLEDGKSTTASQGLVIPVSAPKGNSSSSVLFVKLRDLGF
ncbi:hypothetical protein HF086_000096 [Spodoptera exigua]|uniref:Uncharacterized protein n=1 Tax=Spodoptera exigua TaxID=7107 RepID=A0A922SMA3_SPOEX|nr:hypothetical protein HF086_000096 [Spodoptera exigua]